MLLKTTLKQILSILQDLKGTYRAKDGTVIDTNLLLKSVKRLESWCFPELSEEDISVIIRCKNCRHYKRYRTKSNPKAVPFYACSILHRKTSPTFFCGEGDRHASED